MLLFGGSAYLPALPMVWPMGLGFVCMLGYYFFSVSIFYTKRTTLMAAISLMVALFHLAANWLLVSRLDIYGAALSMLLTFTLLFALTYLVAQRIHPLPVSSRAILLGLLGTAVLVFLLQFITPLPLTGRLPAGMLCLLAWLLYVKRYRHALSSL